MRGCSFLTIRALYISFSAANKSSNPLDVAWMPRSFTYWPYPPCQTLLTTPSPLCLSHIDLFSFPLPSSPCLPQSLHMLFFSAWNALHPPPYITLVQVAPAFSSFSSQLPQQPPTHKHSEWVQPLLLVNSHPLYFFSTVILSCVHLYASFPRGCNQGLSGACPA